MDIPMVTYKKAVFLHIEFEVGIMISLCCISLHLLLLSFDFIVRS